MTPLSEETAQRLIQQLINTEPLRGNSHAPGTCAELHNLEKRIYGNGQPGDVQYLWDKMAELETAQKVASAEMKQELEKSLAPLKTNISELTKSVGKLKWYAVYAGGFGAGVIWVIKFFKLFE